MVKLGVNIDHIATVRQARMGREPDPVHAAVLAELGGADGITVHLREDRRHIQDRDLRLLREVVNTGLNMEMANTDEMIDIALDVKPDMCTLVPEKREELTTEGGLDVFRNFDNLCETVDKLQSADIPVSIFIDPDVKQIAKAADSRAKYIEIHTGAYADSCGPAKRTELTKITVAAEEAREMGLIVNAGHGLNYQNVKEIVFIPGMNELNIGHSIVSRSTLVGMQQAVREMREIMERAVLYGRV